MRLGVVSYDEAPRQADSFVGHFHDAVGHFLERDVPEPLLGRTIVRPLCHERAMRIGTSEAWIAEVDEVETRFDTNQRLAAHVSELERQVSGRLWILIDHGPMKGWRRFLGAKRDVSPCLSVEWDSEYASLTFLDDAWSEYRALDVTHPVMPGEQVRRNIAHGELSPHPTEECLEKARAFIAIREFISKGSRPDWLRYKYVP